MPAFLDAPPKQSALPQTIEHVIVLMLENRSFDHMLGYLDHPDPSFDGLRKKEYQQGHVPIKTTMNARYSISPGPGHEIEDVMHQLLGTTDIPSQSNLYKVTNQGFVANYEQRAKGQGHKITRCFNPLMIPVLTTLAKEYAVCDRWFCSAPMGTFPNRDFLHAGTSYGRAHNSTRPRNHRDTIFFRLGQAGRSWRHYSYLSGAHLWTYPTLFMNLQQHWKHTDSIVEDIQNDRLPTYAFIEPDYGDFIGVGGKGNSQHPSQANSLKEFIGGEKLVANIYNTLAQTPKVFNKTVFVIVYDEHGGFYDHVPPPSAYSPDTHYYQGKTAKGNNFTFKFNVLGPRVPAILISPWIKRGTVDHTEYDHTSIYQSLRLSYCPNSIPNTDRDGTANTFSGVFTRNRPRTLSGSKSSESVVLVQALTEKEARSRQEKYAAPDKIDSVVNSASAMQLALSKLQSPHS